MTDRALKVLKVKLQDMKDDLFGRTDKASKEYREVLDYFLIQIDDEIKFIEEQNETTKA